MTATPMLTSRRLLAGLLGLLGGALALAPTAAHADGLESPATESGAVQSRTRWNERDEVHVTPSPGVTVGEVVIDNRLGDVRVRGWDRPEIRISVRKQAPDEHTLDRLKVRLLTMPDGTIRIRTTTLVGVEERQIPLASARIDLTIELPRDARLAARTWSGDVDVSGVRKGASLETGEGTISVRDVTGKVITHTAKGRQSFDGVRGDVAAAGVASDVELDDVVGNELSAKVFEGSVTAHGVRAHSVVLQTTLGQIIFRGVVLPGGSLDLRSYSGDVSAVLTAPREVEVVARGAGLDPLALGLRDVTTTAGVTIGRHGPSGPRARRGHVELGSSSGVLSLTWAN